MVNLVTKSKKCGACHICELVCSHHHAQVFGRHLSSIEIFKLGAEGGVEILIHDTVKDSHRACDGCADEALPLCVKWCPVGAIVRRKG